MKTVLVTGANRGLGRALVDVFVEAEWRVIAVARRVDDLNDLKASSNVRVESCDLADEQALMTLVESLKDTPIDVLVNNAGMYDAAGGGDNVITKLSDITKVFQVNSLAPKLLSDGLVSNLHAGEDKLVLTVSSGMGTYALLDEYHAQHWVYSASKTAVNYAMMSFGKLHPELKSVLVNPGWLKTDIGGPDAPIEPKDAAQKLFQLVLNVDTLPSGKLLNAEGEELEFKVMQL